MKLGKNESDVSPFLRELYFLHKQHAGVTVPQLTLLLLWLAALLFWLLRLIIKKKTEKYKIDIADPENEFMGDRIKNRMKEYTQIQQSTDDGSPRIMEIQKNSLEKHGSNRQRTEPTIDDILPYVFILGIILFYFYLCDTVKVFPTGQRKYNRDTFLFLFATLCWFGCVFTVTKTPPKIINRDQTEEWKGWMQVLFVWYHYYSASEWYNFIRTLIAAYVWMTGFGNFSFFWIRGDYSLWRLLKMLFRLNFLVLLVCAVTDNQYMLYYICPMHTYWFLSVYAMMAVLRSWNQHRLKMLFKFLVYAVVNWVIFDTGYTATVFKPVSFILKLNHLKHDPLNEWIYRSHLDHWACLAGMLCAYSYPAYERMLHKLECESTKRLYFLNRSIKGAMLTLCCLGFYMWYMFCFRREKSSYLRIHPVASIFPVISCVIIRNIFLKARGYYIQIFAYIGKITLETYISQFHVFLQSNAKKRILYIQGYPLLNMAAATVIYLAISHWTFHITTKVSEYILPPDFRRMTQRLGVSILIFILAVFISFNIKYIC